MNHTEQHVLVCLSSAPSNEKIVRTAANMAAAFQGQFTALFVETPAYEKMSVEDKHRLQENRILAESLGAKAETVYGEEVAYQIAEFARLAGVTQIVLGRSAVSKKRALGKTSLTEQLIFYAPGIDIHIIPDYQIRTDYRYEKTQKQSEGEVIPNSLKSIGILLAATVLCLLFDELGFTDANMIMVYILGVLVISVVTSKKNYSMISAIGSVFLFNFLFTRPRFSFSAYETGYPVTFVVMFLTAFITATLAGQYKEQAKQAAKVAFRTQIVFDTNQMLTKSKDKESIINITTRQLEKLLGRKVWIGNHQDLSDEKFEKEECYKLQTSEDEYGFVHIEGKEEPLDAAENSILISIIGECALALENRKNAEEKEAAAIFAKSEQLRANLLRTISHDLRTPLTSISGNANNLLYNSDFFDEDTKKQLYRDIYDDSLWLISLVENLLSATRIEDGRMQLQLSSELFSDIIEEALRHISRSAEKHKITFTGKDELLLVKADAKLIVQVVVNLLDNALKYTEADSEIVIELERSGSMAQLSVADNGPGIPDEEKSRIFDKFYRGMNKIADNRRSLGLGLYLCKAIIEAHGGKISVKDKEPKGAVFSFTLPLEEVILYE